MKLWLVGLLMLGACSSTGTPAAPPSPSPTPEESATPSTAPSKRYETIEEMLDLLGLEGTTAVRGVGSNGETLRDFIDFTPDEGGSVNIYLFDNQEMREMWRPQIEATFQIIYGKNWLVVPFTHAKLIHSVLGGTLTPVPN